jgi:hypothetical protein
MRAQLQEVAKLARIRHENMDERFGLTMAHSIEDAQVVSATA